MPDRITAARKAFGHALLAERQARKMTQEVLAEKSDLSVNWIGVLERGEQSPTLDSIVQLAAALKTSAAELMARAKL